MTPGCATRRGPKCSGTGPQPGTQRFEISVSPVPEATPSLSAARLIRASPGAAVLRESKEKSNSRDVCCPSAPTLSFQPGSRGVGLAGPRSALHPRNTQPRWKERGEVYSDCGGVGSEAKRDGKVGMPADLSGKMPWLSSLSPAGGHSRLSAELEGSSPAQSSLQGGQPGCTQPWEPGGLMERVRPRQSYAASCWALTQGHLAPGTTGQADALRILVLSLETLALPTSSAGVQVPATQSSGGPKTRPQCPLTSQNGAGAIRRGTFAAGCGPAAGTPGHREGAAEVSLCQRSRAVHSPPFPSPTHSHAAHSCPPRRG